MTNPATSGWVWLDGHIIGNEDAWETVYNWDRNFYASRRAAIHAGLAKYGSDDFNVGRVDNGRLVWFGWMDEPHPSEDCAAVAAQFGWSS